MSVVDAPDGVEHLRGLKGNLWTIRRFGVRGWWRYRRMHRERVVIDYAAVFSPEELALIGEHHYPAPWER